jgi:hypothetical protein
MITNFSVSFCGCNVKKIGTCNTPLHMCFEDLLNGILQAPKFLKFQLVKPKPICTRLVSAEQVVQKNRNKNLAAVLFRNVFYECIEGTSGILLMIGNVYWWSLDDRSYDHLHRKGYCQSFGY